MSKNNSSNGHSNKDIKDANRRKPVGPTDGYDHGCRGGTMSKPSATETRGLSRSPELATGGNAYQSGSAVAKADDHLPLQPNCNRGGATTISVFLADSDREETMWRCDPTSMWQMRDSPADETMVSLTTT